MLDATRKAALKRKPSLMIVIGDAKGPPPIEKEAKKPLAPTLHQEPDGDEAPAEVECPKCGHCFDPQEYPAASYADDETEKDSDDAEGDA